MKYIFVAGAPGSKWSSVVKNIYYSPSVDQSDYSDDRTYYHDASGKTELMHLGAYYDPGMEFGKLFHRLPMYDKETLERDFNEAFTGEGVRIVKSHDDACLGWWVKCGHFDITYPDYSEYYQNLKVMATKIKEQNQGIIKATYKYPGRIPLTNHMLCKMLNIELPPSDYYQDYGASDVRVTVI